MKTKPYSMDSCTTRRCDQEEKESSEFNSVIELDANALLGVSGGVVDFHLKFDGVAQ